jgi:hypothetical protein
MSGYPPLRNAGDPLLALLRDCRDGDLERTAQAIAEAHRACARRAADRGDDRAARFHHQLAGDVGRRLREL